VNDHGFGEASTSEGLFVRYIRGPHLKNSLVKQMSLAHMVHRFLPWLCSLQKKDSGSSAHGRPGSSYVLR
jgi:hypothetical protein